MSRTVGRDEELAAGEAFLDGGTHRLTALIVEGEAGIGKSTIWRAVVQRAEARGFVVLHARPAAAEAPLTLSTLGDLLGSTPERILANLPDGQRRAIDAALLRAEPAGDVLGARLLATAVRSILGQWSQEAPLLLAIDDVQWMDVASATSLGHALRRSSSARIALLATRRSGLPVPIDLATIAEPEASVTIRLGPLTVAALHHLLKARAGRAPTRSTLVRIHDLAGGNPFFALEIAHALGDVDPPVDRPLPVPPDVEGLVRRRISGLTPGTREVLLAMAALAQPRRRTISRALGRGIDADIEDAEARGIVRVSGDDLGFEHPLFAAVIHADADPEHRRRMHGRLADAVDDAEERTRHRALGSSGIDAAVASELDDAARSADARGAPSAAAELTGLALRLTPAGDEADRHARALAQAEYLQRAGDAVRARAVLGDLVDAVPPGRTRALARLALAVLDYEADAGPAASAMAAAAIEDAADDPEVAARAHATVAVVSYEDRRTAATHAAEAMRLLDSVADPDPRTASLVLMAYVQAEADAGRRLPFDAVERALELERRAPAPNVADRMSAALGPLLRHDDDLEGARRWLERTLASALEEGDEGSLPYALSHLPTLELAMGDWDRAMSFARQHLAVATELGLESQRLQALYNVAVVLVHQGRADEARAALAELLDAAGRAGDRWDVANALGALGALELAAGDVGAAARHLAEASATRDAIGDERPRRHDADLVEALVAAGDLDAARRSLVDVVARATRYGRHSWLAQAARARAIVAAARGDADGAVDALAEALEHHDRVSIPFERARTLLVLGQVRRRRRERRAAREALLAALASFESLGASAWAARVRDDLARLGRPATGPDDLTEGERRVVELAAVGRTNREIAAALFISPKTVEANLARAYAKLGVRSRAELAARMAGRRAAPDPARDGASGTTDVGIPPMPGERRPS